MAGPIASRPGGSASSLGGSSETGGPGGGHGVPSDVVEAEAGDPALDGVGLGAGARDPPGALPRGGAPGGRPPAGRGRTRAGETPREVHGCPVSGGENRRIARSSKVRADGTNREPPPATCSARGRSHRAVASRRHRTSGRAATRPISGSWTGAGGGCPRGRPPDDRSRVPTESGAARGERPVAVGPGPRRSRAIARLAHVRWACALRHASYVPHLTGLPGGLGCPVTRRA